MPLIGTLKLRICFSDRHQVPTWTMVKCMANDYLFDLPVGFFIITGLDYWTPDGEPEYHYGIHLEMPPCSPN